MLGFNFDIEYKGVSQGTDKNLANALLQSLQVVFDLKENELRDIALIIQEGIYEDIREGKDYFGNSVEPKKKPSNPGGYRIFVHTGLMAYQGVVTEKVSASEFDVTMIAERKNAAYWINVGTKFMQSRMFFGISDKTRNKINEYLQNLISKGYYNA